MYSLAMSVCSRVVENIDYLSILRHLMALSLIVLKKTCISLELPFRAELNGLCPNSVHKSIHKL